MPNNPSSSEHPDGGRPAGWLDWRALETQIGLEALPAFHRAFLGSLGIDASEMPLRRVQQTVGRELNRLVQQGLAYQAGDPIDAEGAAEISVAPSVLGGWSEAWLGLIAVLEKGSSKQEGPG